VPIFETPQRITATIDIVVVSEVRVVASDRKDTAVDVRPTDPSKKSDVTAAEQVQVEYANGQLLVRSQRDWRLYTPFGGHGSVEVLVELPTGSDVRADSAAGSVYCVGRLGDCRLKSAAGSLSLEDCDKLYANTAAGEISVNHVAGDAEVKAGGGLRIGSIDGTAVLKNSNGDSWVGEITGDLRSNAANGSIVVDHAHGNVQARTANGSVRIRDVARGSVVLGTGMGELEIGIREGTAAWLEVSSGFGKVRNSLEASENPDGAEETVKISARTSFGDILVHRA
jgi:DUF4097 and DUF4098 domain-containing protein YvlB